MGPSHSSSLHIDDDSSTVVGFGRVRDAPIRSAAAGPRNAPGAPPLPLDKDKGKMNLIKYSGGSDYLKSVVQHAVNVGPSKVGPSYGIIFTERYRPPPGVRIWTPDALTFYAASVPGMVCFFEVAFDNGLRFPLHPFMKGVLQHFNICPSQLASNGWGILVGLLAFFRDRGLGVPSMVCSFIFLAQRILPRASFISPDAPELLWWSLISLLHTGRGRDAFSLSAVSTGNTILPTGTTP